MQHWTEMGLEAFSFLSNPQFSNRYMLKVSKTDARKNCDICSESTIKARCGLFASRGVLSSFF